MFLLRILMIIIDHIDEHLSNQYHQLFVSSNFYKNEKILFFEILASNSLSALERRYRICSTLLDHPPSLPSPPLATDSNDKLSDLLVKEQNDIRDDESIISTSTLADDDNIINDIETENIQLLKSLSYNHDKRALSPVLIPNDVSTTKNSELPSPPPSTVDIKKEVNETSTPPGGNELEKKDRPLVEGTDKVNRISYL
jgi:hypothetical protein